MVFPPNPVYPKQIDSDATLFLVHNTTESYLAENNDPWSTEVQIIPVLADKDEIWPDNGFATIEGELFYYGETEKDFNGKVYKLKKCARNLSGSKTKFNPSGTWVRGFVVAEHHNQLVNAVLAVENFVGYNFDPRPETVDWRIRNLQGLATIADDYNCPDVNFTFNIVESDPQTGVLVSYLIEVQSNGTLPTSNFRLDFGDGTFTTTTLSGTHRYAIGANIDPILTISNNNCQYIQSPTNRQSSSIITEFTEVPFEIPLPPTAIIPPINQISLVCADPELQLPPLITPCASLSGIPSVIVGPDINIVSAVTITGPSFPIPSTISFINSPIIPEVIVFDNLPDFPDTISIVGNIPSVIIIDNPSSAIAFSLNLDTLPMLQVDYGVMPPMKLELVSSKPVSKSFTAKNEFGPQFSDIFEDNQTIEYEPVSIPSLITIQPPTEEEMTFKFDTVGLKSTFNEISDMIKDTTKNLTESFKEAIKEFKDQTIKLEQEKPLKLDLNDTLKLEMPSEFPKILLDTNDISIPVTGIPDFIKLQFPEEMPKIPLVYEGNPIQTQVEVKLVMDDMIVSKEDGTTNCVMIVPCNR